MFKKIIISIVEIVGIKIIELGAGVLLLNNRKDDAIPIKEIMTIVSLIFWLYFILLLFKYNAVITPIRISHARVKGK